MKPKISVLISTHNRAAVLRETLAAMEALDRNHDPVEWVIIDNNSTDDTRAVVETFKHRLPLTYLFEPKPGKNCALNKALNECALGDIVVFADDDISPSQNWLTEIRAATARCPSDSVFGGKVLLQWPEGKQPAWLESRWIQEFGFSLHDFGDEEKPYPHGLYPYGPNFWIRKSVIDKGFRYNEDFGPRPKNRLMGSESTFLNTLEAAGLRMIYCPRSIVQHRIATAACKATALRRRAYRYGRSIVLWYGIEGSYLQASRRDRWIVNRLGRILQCFAKLLIGFLHPSPKVRAEKTISEMVALGRNVESFRLGWRTPAPKPVFMRPGSLEVKAG